MKHKIDPDTGLPEVPANHYWLVERSDNPFGFDLVFIGLMKRTKRFKWSKKARKVTTVQYKYIYREDTTPETVLVTANMIMDECAQDVLVNSLVGEYPPKQLPSV